MSGRVRLQNGRPATLERDPTPGEIEAAVMRSHGRSNVLHVGRPTRRMVKDWLHRISSEAGSLPIAWRRAGKKAGRK